MRIFGGLKIKKMKICELPNKLYAFARRDGLVEVGVNPAITHVSLLQTLSEILTELHPRRISIGQIENEFDDRDKRLDWDLGLLMREQTGKITIGARSSGFDFPPLNEIKIFRPKTLEVFRVTFPNEEFRLALNGEDGDWYEIRNRYLFDF